MKLNLIAKIEVKCELDAENVGFVAWKSLQSKVRETLINTELPIEVEGNNAVLTFKNPDMVSFALDWSKSDEQLC